MRLLMDWKLQTDVSWRHFLLNQTLHQMKTIMTNARKTFTRTPDSYEDGV